MTFNVANKVVVYADLNCPFCYALNERMLNLGLIKIVEWRSIQHEPYISGNSCSFEEQTAVASEVHTVRQRAREINIVTPPIRPNTALATQYLLTIQEQDSDLANRFRTQLYRALWQEGLNISRLDVIQECLQYASTHASNIEKCQLPLPSESATALMREWQQLWESGDYSLRIPCALAQDGSALLGFPSTKNLLSFLYDGVSYEESHSDLCCETISKQHIIVQSEHLDLIKLFTHHYHVVRAEKTSEIFRLASRKIAPDLIVLDVGENIELNIAAIREIRLNPDTQRIAILIIARHANEADETRYFENGVSDYIRFPCSETVLHARMRNHLNLKRSSDMLSRMARLDSLTGVYNRREFERLMELEWRRMVREQGCLSILIIDIDRFKDFNDRFGHLSGDECLRRVAQRLSRTTNRPGDIFARYGGEEFVAVLPDTDLQGALTIAEEARLAIKRLELPELSKDQFAISVSIGLASCRAERHRQYDNLIRAADSALLRAKNTGRDKVLYESLDQERIQRDSELH